MHLFVSPQSISFCENAMGFINFSKKPQPFFLNWPHLYAELVRYCKM